MNEQPEPAPDRVPGTDRVTVSMPRGYKARLEAAVADGIAPSVSALVTSAVEDLLARQLTDAWIKSRRGGRPLDPAAVAWARRALGVEDEAPAGVPQQAAGRGDRRPTA